MSDEDLQTLKTLYENVDDFSWSMNRNMDWILKPLSDLIEKQEEKTID